MFEKFTDFDGKQFFNLWGGFSCECFVDGINTFVMFYIKDEEVLSLSGNDANDVLDFVLSEYYENENSTIEDGFSTWLMGHYDNVMPTFDGVEPKFHKGEWVACKELNTAKIINNEGDRYEVELIDGNKGFPHIDYVDRYFHLWNIHDAKDGDILQLGFVTAIFQKCIGNNCKCYCSVCEGEFEIPSQDGDDNIYGCYNAAPANKEQRDTLFAKMKEVGYEWDYKEKELKKNDRQNIVNFDKEAEKEETLTTDDIPLSVLYKTLLKDCKRQDRIIEKQKKEIKKLKDKVDKYSIKNYEMRKQLERYGVTTEKGENLHKIIIDLNRAVQKRNDKIRELQMRINELSSSV